MSGPGCLHISCKRKIFASVFHEYIAFYFFTTDHIKRLGIFSQKTTKRLSELALFTQLRKKGSCCLSIFGNLCCPGSALAVAQGLLLLLQLPLASLLSA